MHPRFLRTAFAVCAHLLSIIPALAAGSANPKFVLPAMDGIVEGIAYRPKTGDFFFGDVHNRCVWRRDHDGHLTRFTAAEAPLFGVFNLVVDESRHRLWLGTAMVPETRGYSATDRGHAALMALDLESGDVLATFPAPADHRDHVFGDLLLGDDGAVYVTDSTAPVIWKLRRDSTRLEVLADSPRFRSLQGLGFIRDRSALVVTDYGNGLFAVDIASGGISAISAPTGVDLRGLDGIVVEGNTVFAVHNAREPNSVLRLVLSRDATKVADVEVFARGAPGFSDLTLITRGPSGLCVIANSGWALADAAKTPDISKHDVTVFELSD